MSSQTNKKYTKKELRQMRRAGMITVMKKQYNQTERDCKLGHLLNPYVDAIWKLQGGSAGGSAVRKRGNNSKSKGKRKQKPKKFNNPSTNAEFEKEKTRVARRKKKKNKHKRKHKNKDKNKNHKTEMDMDVSGESSDDSSHSTDVERDNGYYEHGLREFDSLDAFAENVNAHFGKEVFTAECLESVKGEGLTLDQFEALMVGWDSRKVLIDKGGDIRMRTSAVMSIFEYMQKQQSNIETGNIETGNIESGKSESGESGKRSNKNGSKKMPFLGNDTKSPDYVDMTRYVTDDTLAEESLSIASRIYYRKRYQIWMALLALIRECKRLKAENERRNIKKKIYASAVYEKGAKTFGDHKYLWLMLLISPPIMEDIYIECDKRVSGKAVLDYTRNKLADRYGRWKDDLSNVHYYFDDSFVDSFQKCLGGDIWNGVKSWYETSSVYQEYVDEKEREQQ